ncbi:MAG: hypothetical protein NTV89_18220 [Proteobacteria bacterium]|nr:hypothetical protein [Pseudomonadota bacterium]
MVLTLSLLSAVPYSYSGVPQLINYQGKLTNAGGSPLNGTFVMSFTVYDAESGGTSLWTETQSSVAVNNGVFNVILGSGPDGKPNTTDDVPISASVFYGDQRWLGVKIGSDSEMTPRTRFTSVGYAITADNLGGGKVVVDTDGKVGIGTQNPSYNLQIIGEAPTSSGTITMSANKDANYFTTSAPITLRTGDVVLPNITQQARLVAIGSGSITGTTFNIYPYAGNITAETFQIYHTSYIDISSPDGPGVLKMGTNTSRLNAGTPNAGHSEIGSSWDDNFYIKTFDDNPNANFSLGIGDGAGGWTHTPITWNNMLILNGSGKTWCPSCGVSVGPNARADMVITGDGNVGIGTTNPQYKLDIEGYMQAKGYYTGDIFFQKDGKKLWRMFEKEDGLYLESMTNGKISRVFLEQDIVALKEQIKSELKKELLTENINADF